MKKNIDSISALYRVYTGMKKEDAIALGMIEKDKYGLDNTEKRDYNEVTKNVANNLLKEIMSRDTKWLELNKECS